MAKMKAYKFRIYPNKEQTTLINKTIGCARFVFNYSLSKQQEKESRGSWIHREQGGLGC